MRFSRNSLGGMVLALSIAVGSAAPSTPTKVRVRAVSKDAKIIGTSVGGALITITDLVTGEILARGTQLGGTGDTQRIMVQPHERYGRVFDTEGAAFYETTLMLDRPTVVEISAEGPLGYPQARHLSSKTLLLLPGQHISGEGVVLEIHGLIVQLLEPAEGGERLAAGSLVRVRARLNMA